MDEPEDRAIANEDDGDDEVELPPPMKPISESVLVTGEDKQIQVRIHKVDNFVFFLV